MTATQEKTKTCPRCKGTGFVNTGVLHLGIPGLCMKCNGRKYLLWRSAAELEAQNDRYLSKWLDELRWRIEQLAEVSARPENAAKPHRQKYFAGEIEKLRATEAEVKSKLHKEVTRGAWQ